MGIDDRDRIEHGKCALRHREHVGAEALREQIRGGEVAAQVVEDVREAVRPIGPSVAVEIGLGAI